MGEAKRRKLLDPDYGKSPIVRKFGEINLLDEKIKDEFNKINILEKISLTPNLWAMHDLNFGSEVLKCISFTELDFSVFDVETVSVLRFPIDVENKISKDWEKKYSEIINRYCNETVSEAISRVNNMCLGSPFLHATPSHIAIYALINSQRRSTSLETE